MKEISKLGGDEKIISYEIVDGNINFKWKTFESDLDYGIIENILEFLKGKDWTLQGSNIMKPEKGGVGEYLLLNEELSPRFAELLLSVMVNEELLEYKEDKGNIYVRII